jgi:hypothetical protein
MRNNLKSFAPTHPWDRNFFLLMAAFAWLGIGVGFGREIARHLATHEAAYPFIIHFHSVIFLSWLVLFTVQILLIRFKRLAVHKRLGIGMAGLAAVMVITGPVTALTMQHRTVNRPDVESAFLIVQLTNILTFAGLVTAGILLRKVPAAHKRLMLLSTLYITAPGFLRWLGDPLGNWLGNGYWATWVVFYFASNVLVLGAAAYDLATRRRVHPVIVAGAAWAFANQMTAVSLFFSHGWLVLAKKMIDGWTY